jgi:hypothetical protein
MIALDAAATLALDAYDALSSLDRVGLGAWSATVRCGAHTVRATLAGAPANPGDPFAIPIMVRCACGARCDAADTVARIIRSAHYPGGVRVVR